MNTTTLPLAAAGTRTRPVASSRLLQALVGALLALDAWCAARRRRSDDMALLAQMSDYELRDVGLHRLDTLSDGALFQSGRMEMR